MKHSVKYSRNQSTALAGNGCTYKNASINYVVFMADFSAQIVDRWMPKEDDQNSKQVRIWEVANVTFQCTSPGLAGIF